MIELNIIDDLVNNTKKVFKGYQFKQYGDNKPTAVILGENHVEKTETTLERCFQENLIRTLKPKYVLIEVLSDLNENSICFEHWREKHNCKLEPCDLSDQEKADRMREILNRYPLMLSGLENCHDALEVISYFEYCKNSSTRSMYPDLELLEYDARETRMGENIIKFSKESSEPVIEIIGHWHARCDSKIHETLEGYINYVCIWNEEWVDKKR